MAIRASLRTRSTGPGLARRARKAEQRQWFRRVERAGLTARGTIYFILSGLAFEIAVKGSSNAPADSQGALIEIGRQPTGPFLLAILAAGFAAYAAWRFVQTVAGDPGRQRAGWIRLGWAASGLLYVFLCGEAAQLAAGSSATASERPGPFVARVLTWPAGSELLGFVATVTVVAGVGLGTWGIVHDYREVIDDRQLGRWFGPVKLAGMVGDVARALLVLLVAAYLFAAAATDDPQKAKGLGGALQSFAHLPGGPELLGLIGTGLVGFASYSLAEAGFRRSAA